MTSIEKPSEMTHFFQGMQPRNRLRSAASSVICSRCTSFVSVNHSRVASRCTSQLSLYHMQNFNRKSSNTKSEITEPPILCKICLVDYVLKDTYKIQQCGCIFCKEVYLNTDRVNIMNPKYFIALK